MSTIGRLKSFGPTKPSELPFLLPSGWDDLTAIVTDFKKLLPGGQRVVIRGISAKTPSTHATRFKAVRMSGAIADSNGKHLVISAFGNTRDLQLALEPGLRVTLTGKLEMYNHTLQLTSPEIVEEKWCGRWRPKYPGKPGYLKASTVRDTVAKHLVDQIPQAAKTLRNRICLDETRLLNVLESPAPTLEGLLQLAHLPAQEKQGIKAHQTLQRLGAYFMLSSAQNSNSHCMALLRLPPDRLIHRLKYVPWPLTDEQLQATQEIVQDMDQATPMSRMLLGDVGTGKTIVYALACACVADSGGHVAVILPSATLAAQIHQDMSQWFPDLDVVFITANSKQSKETGNNKKGGIHVGTTALLHNNPTLYALVVSDEEQKFGTHQRQALVALGTHSLSATACAIPRSQALAQFGFVNISKLSKAHVDKKIITKLHKQEDRHTVFASIKESVIKGNRVLIVYPKIDGAVDDKQSLTRAQAIWEKTFAGRVRMVHSKLPDEDKRQAIVDVDQGRADILIATTAVEVGVNIRKLNRAVVVDAEKFGLVTLHQIRGRVARQGGTGFFDLLYNQTRTSDVTERLNVLVKHSDGFRIAQEDLRLRGSGNLASSGKEQSGHADSFLFGRAIRHEDLDFVMDNIKMKPKITTA